MCPSSTRISATEVAIRVAQGPADIAACRSLFVEYEKAIGVSLCFQGFAREVATLPGDYAPPRGRLWLAEVDGRLAGCAALRPLDGQHAEMKRLYVRADFRGLRLGRALAEKVIDAARELGYARLFLDTLPSMREAQRLYAKLGFADCEPYNDNPIGGVRFMCLRLDPGP